MQREAGAIGSNQCSAPRDGALFQTKLCASDQRENGIFTYMIIVDDLLVGWLEKIQRIPQVVAKKSALPWDRSRKQSPSTNERHALEFFGAMKKNTL